MTFDREAVRASLQDRCAQCPISEGDKLCGECPDADLGAALDEIERLRGLLREWQQADGDTDNVTRIPRFVAVSRRTRAALDRGRA